MSFLSIERTKSLRIFTKRATINSLERNLNYDKSLEMMILKKERKWFKMQLCSLALLRGIRFLWCSSPSVWNFNGTLVRLSSPGSTLSSDSVSSRVSVHLHKCQLSEICSWADALGWEVQSTCSGLASHHWVVRAEGSQDLKTQYRKIRSVRSWGTSVLYHIEVSLFCFISLCRCKSVFLARSYCVL